MQVPDTKVAEIIDGELIVSPRPASPHALAAAEIAFQLGPRFHGHEALSGPGGWWILPEPELHLTDDVLVPDLAAWRCARMPTIPNHPAFTLAPDWVCEIMSPSSVRRDRIARMRCYAREGIASVWLVDPIARTLESFRLDGDRWIVLSSHEDDETPRVDPFDEVEIRLARCWLPATDPT